MGTINLIRALMYLGKSVPVKGKEKERQKKRDRDTERARGGPKRHTNYGPSLSVSIPMLRELRERVAQAWLAQNPAFIQRRFGRLERCVAAQGGHIEL